jgi:hypothetical protein
MKNIWIPSWDIVDLGPDGGTFDETSHPKACVHTTEGTTIAGAEAAYKAYPPHLGYDPIRRIKHQYVPLNRYSYAFRNGETDDEFIIQVEVVGFASQTHKWPITAYANFSQDVIKPLEELVGIPRQHLRFYRADEGIVLARKTSPIRLRPAALRSYSGWMGHQHAPGVGDNGAILASGDEHWDPGGFLMDLAFSFLQPKSPTPPSPTPTKPAIQEEDEVKTYYIKGDNTAKMPAPHQTISWGDAVFLVEATVEGLKRRHIHAEEWRAAEATGAKVTQHPQAWVDSLPLPGGLWPWENAGGGPVSGDPS